jgi:YidC/Oxa1 family membrane protein insertase
VLFVINFPAGLLVYWITTNLWTIVQQTIVRKRLGPLRPPDAEPAPGLGSALGDLFRGGGGSSASDAKKNGDAPRARARGSKDAEAPKARPAGPPPASPRKKKKRSGRRR